MAGFRLKKKAREDQGAEETHDGCGTRAGSEVAAVESNAQEVPQGWPQMAPAPLQGKRSGTVRLTLAVPRSLHTRLKVAAVLQGRSIVSLVSAWIEERTVAA